MEFNIGTPETVYLLFLITGFVMRVYESAIESTNRIDLVASIVAIVMSCCIEIALLIWGGFFS